VDPASPVEFIVEQIVTMHPLTLPIWLAGLYYYLFSSAGQPYRALGWIYVVLFVLFVIQNAKFYFLAPAYPMLFAAGGLQIERFVRRRRWGRLKPAYVVILLVGGTVVAPLVAVPALPVETLAKITGAAGGDAGVEVETREVGQLPQQFADRFGWETMVATVADVYRDLPPEERAESCIFTGNYGEAGAIEFFGSQYDLPKAISGHNNYYIWGPGDCTGQVIIAVGVPLSPLEAVFDDVEQVDTSDCEYCMPDEDNLPIYVGRNPKASLQEIWPQVKHYN
jgi:hypothetical protein